MRRISHKVAAVMPVLAGAGAALALAVALPALAARPPVLPGRTPTATGTVPIAPAPTPPPTGTPPPNSPPKAFTLRHATISPRHAYVAGRPVRIDFEIATTTATVPPPATLRVDLVRTATGRPVRRFTLRAVVPGVRRHLTWNAVTGAGAVAPNGRYRVRVSTAAGTARNAGTFELHSHIYPIRGPHADRGGIGVFGAPRDGGRTHEGFDVMAPCGTPLVAARGGRVVRSTYDPVLYGNLVIIHGDHTARDYWYAHLQHASPLRAGDHVLTGQRIGRVGETGNARTVGCHLHFEIHVRGVPIDPAPELHAWDAWS